MILVLLALLAPPPATTVRTIDYHGWKGSIQLSNGDRELVFVPQIGRIMRFGPKGGPNMLWENPRLAGKTVDLKNPGKDWVNFGGDKLWPAPQDRWGWPPDPTIDAGHWTVKVLARGRILATGTASKKHGIRFVREISLDLAGGVVLKNTMVNTSKQLVKWSVWEVVQVDRPANAVIPASKNLSPPGYREFKDMKPGHDQVMLRDSGDVIIKRDVNKNLKIGSDAIPGWALAYVQGRQLEVRAAGKDSGTFPDNGCTVEVYGNPDPDAYMELELLSPIHALGPGQRYTFETRWHLSGPRG